MNSDSPCTKHQLTGKGHFDVSYTIWSLSEMESPHGSDLKQSELGQRSIVTNLCFLPTFMPALTVTGAPSGEQDFRRTTLSYPHPPNIRDIAHTPHCALAFLPREDQGLCLLDSGRRYASRLTSVGGSPVADLWKCFQAVCLRHGVGSRNGTHQYAKRCLQHLSCLIKKPGVGVGWGGFWDQAVAAG